MYKPFFSVVIPTYNRSSDLLISINSVLEQTLRDFEILIIDDGSSDNTREVVNQLLIDPRIKYYWIPNSGGPATPRNKGIDLAIGEWICFLDADDIWYNNKLENIYQCIIYDNTSEVICNNEYLNIVNSKKKVKLFNGPYEYDFYKVMLLYGNRCSTSATSVKRSFLNEHKLRFNTSAEYVIVEDYDLWLRLAYFGAKFIFLENILGEYIIKDTNISSNIRKSRMNEMRVLYDHVYKIQRFDKSKNRLWSKIKSRVYISHAIEDFYAGRFKSCFKNAVKSISSNPFTFLNIIFRKFFK